MTHASATQTRSGLTSKSILAYVLPGVPSGIMLYAVGVIVPGYYVSEIGLPAALVGAVLLGARMLDLTFEFTVGALSDRTRTRAGRRKPWILAGAVIIGIGFYALMTPDPGASWQRFLFASLAYYVGWAVLTVPYDAWGSELAHDYASRARIFTYKAAALFAGSLVFSLFPILPMFASSEFSPEVMRFTALVVAVTLVVFIPIAMRFVPAEPPPTRSPATLKGLLGALLKNPPLRLYTIAAVLCGLSNGVFSAVTYIYQSDYMGFASMFWLMLIIYLVASIAALPLWTFVIRRIGKHRAWSWGLLLNSLCFPPMVFLKPGEASFLPTLVLLALAGATYSVVNAATPAVLGDVVDHESLRSGVNRAGGFFALQALITKLTVAVGGGVAFLIVGFSGFQAGSGAGPQRAGAVCGIRLAYIFAPAVLNVLALFFLWRFPLDRRAMSIIHRRLALIDSRRAGGLAPAAEPAGPTLSDGSVGLSPPIAPST